MKEIGLNLITWDRTLWHTEIWTLLKKASATCQAQYHQLLRSVMKKWKLNKKMCIIHRNFINWKQINKANIRYQKSEFLDNFIFLILLIFCSPLFLYHSILLFYSWCFLFVNLLFSYFSWLMTCASSWWTTTK